MLISLFSECFGKISEKTGKAMLPIRFTIVRRKLPCKVFSRRFFCARETEIREGFDMENREKQTNLLPTEAGNNKREKIRTIPITLIDSASTHPFQVRDDSEMRSLMESIAQFGVISPCIVRKKGEDRYELISGHRRKRACELLGIGSLPVIIRELSEDDAVILMVDSNLQREHILPSEKAFAYKLKMEALKRQGKRSDITLTPVVSKLRTGDMIGKDNGDSREQVRRYIRLTCLIPELLENVDLGKIAFRPAVELSYLSEEEQKDLSYTIDTVEATPSLAQAIQMRKLSHEGKLDLETIEAILSVQKPNQVEKIKIPSARFEKYFRRGTPQSEIETVIFAALEEYYRKRRRQQTN